jgi:hypothetical protein
MWRVCVHVTQVILFNDIIVITVSKASGKTTPRLPPSALPTDLCVKVRTSSCVTTALASLNDGLLGHDRAQAHDRGEAAGQT